MRTAWIFVTPHAGRRGEAEDPAGHHVGDQREALAVAVGHVVVAHARQLADSREQLRIEPLALALAVLVQAAHGDQRVSRGVDRHAEDVLAGLFKNAVLVVGPEPAEAHLDRRGRRHLQRAVRVEGHAFDTEIRRWPGGCLEDRVVRDRPSRPFEDGRPHVHVRVAVLRVERQQPCRAHRQRDLGDRHLLLGFGGRPRKRDRGNRRIDRKGEQILVAAALAQGHVAGEARPARQADRAGAVEVGQGVTRPQRHAALRRRARDVGPEAQWVVPGHALDVVVERRAVPTDAQHAGVVAPLEGGLQFGGARIHRHRQLHGVAMPEGAAERNCAFTGRVLHLKSDVG